MISPNALRKKMGRRMNTRIRLWVSEKNHFHEVWTDWQPPSSSREATASRVR
jgi:hypothetical protein